MCVYVCAHTCGSQRFTSTVFLDGSSPYFLKQRLSLNLKLTVLVKLYGQQATTDSPGSATTATSALGLQETLMPDFSDEF